MQQEVTKQHDGCSRWTSREVKEWVAPGGNDRKDMHIELVSHISCELHKQIVCGHKFTLIFPVHQGRCIYHLKSYGTFKIWPVNTLYRHTYKPAFCQGNVHSSLVHSPLNTQP